MDAGCWRRDAAALRRALRRAAAAAGGGAPELEHGVLLPLELPQARSVDLRRGGGAAGRHGHRAGVVDTADGSEERDAANVEVLLGCRLSARLGIPVIGEYFPTDHEHDAGAASCHVKTGARIVAELGADAIKTFNTKNFREVTGTCPVPVLGLGAEKLPTQRPP